MWSTTAALDNLCTATEKTGDICTGVQRESRLRVGIRHAGHASLVTTIILRGEEVERSLVAGIEPFFFLRLCRVLSGLGQGGLLVERKTMSCVCVCMGLDVDAPAIDMSRQHHQLSLQSLVAF